MSLLTYKPRDYTFWKKNGIQAAQGKENVSLLQAYIDSCKGGDVHVKGVKMCINAGVNIDHKDTENKNVLWNAFLSTDDIEVYKVLISAEVTILYNRANNG